LPQFWSRIGEQVRDLLATEEIKEITKCIWNKSYQCKK
jgi:hypothetical protein